MNHLERDPTEGVSQVEEIIVTAGQMQQIESALFAAGLPVPALMEKVSHRIADWVMHYYPCDRAATIGFIIGPGHNGGDGLVVARELFHRGYSVVPWCPFTQVKPLTAAHRSYLNYLGISDADSAKDLQFCDLIIDGGFGFGLTRPPEGAMAAAIKWINQGSIPVVSVDLPTGITTDTGAALGTPIRADHTLCLGLWKLGLLQDAALPWVGQAHLIPFDIPQASISQVLEAGPPIRRLSATTALSCLPLHRSAIAHKYTVGQLLLIAGSRQYAGAALLAGMGAIASGVGMVTMVVPESLKPLIVGQLPEALVVAASETDTGAIAELPSDIPLDKYDAIACGPGLTLQASAVIQTVFEAECPLLLDADGLNWLATQSSPLKALQQRSVPTLLTPHLGEFRRLFPDLLNQLPTPSAAAHAAAQTGCCTLVLKGAISAIAHADGQLWFNPHSTPALARGGSGDVLTGLASGLAAQWLRQGNQADNSLLSAALAAVWWHAHTARNLAAERTLLGCAPSELARHLPLTLAHLQRQYVDPSTL